MSKGIKWVLGILFGSLIVFAAWKIFSNPTFILGETARVDAKVIDVFPSREVKTYRRRVKYMYAAENKYYYDFFNLGTQDKKQEIGNTIQISYSKKYPRYNIVEKLLSDYRSSREVQYYSIKETGYIDIRLINGIYKYKEYADQGKMVNNFVGEYAIENDSVHFTPYIFGPDTLSTDNLKLLVFDSKNSNQLNDTNSDRIFTRIKTKNKKRQLFH